MKKAINFVLGSVALFLGSSVLAATAPQIAVSIYSQNDDFMKNYAGELQNAANSLNEPIVINYAQDDMVKEIQQLQLAVESGAKSLIVNPVDPESIGQILKLAKENGNLPLVFINRKPKDKVLDAYANAWYVGSNAAQSGIFQAEILTDYISAHPEADLNKDGKISYFLLQGEANLPDTELRSSALKETLDGAETVFEEIGSVNANWQFDIALSATESFIRRVGIDKVEAIVANNDAMALGALQYLKSIGYNNGDSSKFIPVLGIDGTQIAVDAVNKKQMVGTVKNDFNTQARLALKIARMAGNNETVNKDSLGYAMTADKDIYVPYIKITLK